MRDFSEIAKPYLDSLRDDGDRGPPKPEQVTTSPIGDDTSLDDLPAEDLIFVETADGDMLLSSLPGLRPVDVDAVDAAQSVFREIGVNALAFYKSFRFKDRAPYPGKWGVFLIDAGIMAVAKEFRDQTRPPSQHEAERLAVQTLLQHERYHFWIDVWALAQETSALTSLLKCYEYYVARRHNVALTEYDDEESLANFYVLSRLREAKLADGSNPSRLIRHFFDQCPVPYSLHRLTAAERAMREHRLATSVISGLDGITAQTLMALHFKKSQGDDLAGIVAHGVRPRWSSYPFAPQPLCPTYLIRDRNYAARVAPFQGPDQAEFKRFIIAYLAGEELRRTDHLYFKIDNGETIKFPNSHKEKNIRGYELKPVLLKAGMRNQEFQSARQQTNGWKKGCPRPEPKPPLAGDPTT
jgi:hypothetical protein